MRPFLRTTQCIGKTCRQRAASYDPQLQGQERIKAGNITLSHHPGRPEQDKGGGLSEDQEGARACRRWQDVHCLHGIMYVEAGINWELIASGLSAPEHAVDDDQFIRRW